MYLIEFIKKSQAEYPSISLTPFSVLCHLLYTNGNGYGLKNGNFTTYIDLQEIELRHLYSSNIDFSDYKEFYNHRHFDENFKNTKRGIIDLLSMTNAITNTPMPSDDEINDMVYDKLDKMHDGIDSIDNYSLNDLKNKEFYLQYINDKKYNSLLHISPKYYLQYDFTENTDRDTLEIAIAISSAYVEYYQNILINQDVIDNKKFSFSTSKEQYIKSIMKELELLYNDIENMQDILNTTI